MQQHPMSLVHVARRGRGTRGQPAPAHRVALAPRGQKPPADLERLRTLPPAGVREAIGDGNYGGAYEKPDAQMLEIWRVAVEETPEISGTI
jgi:hypothetical protein